jgi:hypothetical protein
LKQAQCMPALRVHCTIGRAMASLAVAILAFAGGCTDSAWADPLAVAPASSTSWERFDPTLELPRIYNPDGSLPPGAEMPGAAVMPEASPGDASPPPGDTDPAAATAPPPSDPADPAAAAALPPPDAIDPAAASAPSPSAPSPSVPPVAHGDPPVGPDPNAGTTEPAAAEDDDAEPDPESELAEPSRLDPSEGIDTEGVPSRAGQNDSSDPSANGQGDQDEEVDPPSVVLIPPPYYGPPQPIYGYPYYGPTLGRYSYSNVAPPPATPPGAAGYRMPPPAYRWIGNSPSWTSMHSTSMHSMMRGNRMMQRSFSNR